MVPPELMYFADLMISKKIGVILPPMLIYFHHVDSQKMAKWFQIQEKTFEISAMEEFHGITITLASQH